MCGILYVESRTARPLPQHLAAVDVLSSRGPDFVRYQHQGHDFAIHPRLQDVAVKV